MFILFYFGLSNSSASNLLDEYLESLYGATMGDRLKRRVVVLGGGTGTFGVLSGLYNHDQLDITAVCTTFDDGGHTGELKDEHGLVLPHGDLRQALIALMPPDGGTLRELLLHRFPTKKELDLCEGELSPKKKTAQSLGNLLIAAAEQIWGPVEGLRRIAEVLHLDHHVYPTSINEAKLVAELSDGSTIVGEHVIDNRGKNRDDDRTITKLALDKPAFVLKEPAEAIRQADLIVFGPGDLYTSILPHLLVKGVQEALLDSRGRIVFVVNLMTKKGETSGFSAADFVETLISYGISPRRLDAVFVNTGEIPEDLRAKYWEKEQAAPVTYDASIREKLLGMVDEVIEGTFWSKAALKAGITRHDSTELARSIMGYLERTQ